MAAPELLMPGGNLNQAVTALDNGADAVYVGAPAFNARLNARNLTIREIAGLVKYAEDSDKKVFVAMNTLIRDSAFTAALAFLEDIYTTGCHAVIVQDLGLLNAASELFPDMGVHASTQATAHNSAGVNFLADIGADRVILSRELHLDEIRGIRANTKCELETFIHGALCYCLSGQCLFSSFAFRRSGNQGVCAQPCRLEYKSGDKRGYLLSLNDQALGTDVRKLFGLVDCVKVEGRMKSAEYAGAVASYYRKILDGRPLEERDLDDVLIAYNRGTSKGYLEGTPGFNTQYPYSLGIEVGKTDARGQLELKRRVGIGDTISFAAKERKDFDVDMVFVDGKPITGATTGKVTFRFALPPNTRIYLTKSKSLTVRFVKSRQLAAKPSRPMPGDYETRRSEFLEMPIKYAKNPLEEKRILFFEDGALQPMGYADTLPFMTDAQIDAMPKDVLARNLGAYSRAERCVLGPELNVSNRYSARLFPKAELIVPSLELSRRETLALAEYAPLALYVYGRIRLMVSRSPAPTGLEDRKGFKYETERYGELSYIFNPFKLSLLSERRKFVNSALQALLFEELDDTAEAFLNGAAPEVRGSTKGWF